MKNELYDHFYHIRRDHESTSFWKLAVKFMDLLLLLSIYYFFKFYLLFFNYYILFIIIIYDYFQTYIYFDCDL